MLLIGPALVIANALVLTLGPEAHAIELSYRPGTISSVPSRSIEARADDAASFDRRHEQALRRRACHRWSELRNLARRLFPALAERTRQSAGALSTSEAADACDRPFIGAPELVLCDEPSLGLAPNDALAVLKAIRELNIEGLTWLLTDQNVSLKLAARRYVLESGRIVLAGRGSALLEEDRVRQSYQGL
jgi:ABC-type branched-subunit amino acid transport system ATPase component